VSAAEYLRPGENFVSVVVGRYHQKFKIQSEPHRRLDCLICAALRVWKSLVPRVKGGTWIVY